MDSRWRNRGCLVDLVDGAGKRIRCAPSPGRMHNDTTRPGAVTVLDGRRCSALLDPNLCLVTWIRSGPSITVTAGRRRGREPPVCGRRVAVGAKPSSVEAVIPVKSRRPGIIVAALAVTLA